MSVKSTNCDLPRCRLRSNNVAVLDDFGPVRCAHISPAFFWVTQTMKNGNPSPVATNVNVARPYFHLLA